MQKNGIMKSLLFLLTVVALVAFLFISAAETWGKSLAAQETLDISGKWNSNIGLVYEFTQNGDQFTWFVALNDQKGGGTLNGHNLSASWSDAGGSGSAEGRITAADANGRAGRIEWDNGVVFEREGAVSISSKPAQIAQEQKGQRRSTLQPTQPAAPVQPQGAGAVSIPSKPAQIAQEQKGQRRSTLQPTQPVAPVQPQGAGAQSSGSWNAGAQPWGEGAEPWAEGLYLYINGIKGSLTAPLDWFEVMHVKQSLSSLQSPSSLLGVGSGGDSGGKNAPKSPLVIIKVVDNASPILNIYCLTGRFIPDVTLVCYVPGINYRVIMNDVMISAIEVVGPDEKGRILENVSLDFARCTWEFHNINPDGSPGTITKKEFDFRSNKVI
jgi:type VI secretion system secreted protein Hcp